MFKSIKEFFVGKPKVEEPVVQTPEIVPVPDPAPVVDSTLVVEPAPVEVAKQEITPDTVIISVSDNMSVTLDKPSDTITLTPVVEPGAWPFPNTPPAEVKKKRTFVKREEPVTNKKPTPAIKANSKPRKKK